MLSYSAEIIPTRYQIFNKFLYSPKRRSYKHRLAWAEKGFGIYERP
jgi:hypothetical protein